MADDIIVDFSFLWQFSVSHPQPWRFNFLTGTLKDRLRHLEESISANIINERGGVGLSLRESAAVSEPGRSYVVLRPILMPEVISMLHYA